MIPELIVIWTFKCKDYYLYYSKKRDDPLPIAVKVKETKILHDNHSAHFTLNIQKEIKRIEQEMKILKERMSRNRNSM